MAAIGHSGCCSPSLCWGQGSSESRRWEFEERPYALKPKPSVSHHKYYTLDTIIATIRMFYCYFGDKSIEMYPIAVYSYISGMHHSPSIQSTKKP